MKVNSNFKNVKILTKNNSDENDLIKEFHYYTTELCKTLLTPTKKEKHYSVRRISKVKMWLCIISSAQLKKVNFFYPQTIVK